MWASHSAVLLKILIFCSETAWICQWYNDEAVDLATEGSGLVSWKRKEIFLISLCPDLEPG
jgi:hypothetical protein